VSIPQNTHAPTTWMCPKGHFTERSLHTMQGCSVCTGRMRKTADDYHAMAASRGLEWLGPEVARARDLTNWKCSKGHVCKSTYNKLQQGRGLYCCSGQVSLTVEDVRARGAALGLVLVSEKVGAARSDVTFRCVAKGHEVVSTPDNLKSSTGCRYCNGSAIYRMVSKEVVWDYVRKHKMDQLDYRAACKEKRLPEGFPSNPTVQYGERWGWFSGLTKGDGARRGVKWPEPSVVRAFFREHGLNVKTYKLKGKADALPDGFPTDPHEAYGKPWKWFTGNKNGYNRRA
jgi:hypothetical protein